MQANLPTEASPALPQSEDDISRALFEMPHGIDGFWCVGT
jgi:hypothetical protein